MTAPMVCVPVETLRAIYGMAREGCESPTAAYRWCERIDEVFHGLDDEYAEYARDLPELFAPAPAPPQAVQGEYCSACKMQKHGPTPILSCACATLVMHSTPANGEAALPASGDVERHLKVLREMRAVADMLDDEEAAALDAAIAALRSQGQAVAVDDDGAIRRVAKALNSFRFDESTPEQAWRGLHAKERRYWDSMAEAAVAALAQQANKDAPKASA